MRYELDCDSCEYNEIVDEEVESYAMARDHEQDYPDHFVYIFEVQGEGSV